MAEFIKEDTAADLVQRRKRVGEKTFFINQNERQLERKKWRREKTG